MKNWFRKICLILCSLNLLTVVYLSFTLGFFFSGSQITGIVSTGSVEVIIDNLEVENNNFIDLKRKNVETMKDEYLNGGTLIPDSLASFTFLVKNIGMSNIKYNLQIGISLSDELSEKGKFLLYPSYMENSDIFLDIDSKRYEYAIIDTKVSDLKEIPFSLNNELGILETIDSVVLDSKYLGDDHLKEYGYKLVLITDEEININPKLLEGKYCEVNLIITSDVLDINSNWKSIENQHIRFQCKADEDKPVIEEKNKPKTFFINQTNDINLLDYVVAIDNLDGIITDKVMVTSVPAFNKDKEGTYKIIYNVTNSRGKSAIPLEITIVIWNFVKLSAGDYHVLALTSKGQIYSWGYNDVGQLGIGKTIDIINQPQLITTLNNIIDIQAGTRCSLALDANGQVYSWGSNEFGSLGDGTFSNSNIPIKIRQQVGVKFEKISLRCHSAGAITSTGDVYTWGYGGFGILGNGNDKNVLLPTKIALSNVEQLELGFVNGAAITKDNKLYTWGNNSYGQLGNSSKQSKNMRTTIPTIVNYFNNNSIDIKSISIGYYHMAATSSTGYLYTWGMGAGGRLGNSKTDNVSIPQKIEVLGRVTKVVASCNYTGIITENSRAYFFGENHFGELGTGDTEIKLVPTLLKQINDVQDISLALYTSLVLLENGDIYAMGYGGTGLLGNKYIPNPTIPNKLPFTPLPPY